MRHRYDDEAYGPPDEPEFSDTDPVDEPIIDYSIWPSEPLYSEEARDESLRRLGKLTWRAIQLSAVAAAGFAVLFVRTAPAPVATSQDVARPAGTVTAPPSPTPSPTPSARHPHHRARARAGNPAPSPAPDASLAPGTHAPGSPSPSPTLTPPTTPPAPSPSPSPAQSTSSGSHSGG
jgi:hypothetical protein